MNYKGAFPFRIGCTSYVLPDDILPNVTYMADKVDDIELVLFESEGWSNLPDSATVSSMQHIADKHDITFSVHFPIDRSAGSENTRERDAFLGIVTDIIRLSDTLPVSGYLLHLEGLKDQNNPFEVERWFEASERFCRQLVASTEINPELICIENLNYPPELHAHLIDTYRFSHCIDLGHLWLYGTDWTAYTQQVIDKTKVIHLHGVSGGKDHLSLKKHAQKDQLQSLSTNLSEYRGVVTLEVFSEEDTFSSLELLGELWRN